MTEPICRNDSTRLTVALYMAPLLADGSVDADDFSGPLECNVLGTSAQANQSIDYHKGRGCKGQIAHVYTNPAESKVSLEFKGVAPVVLLGHLLGASSVIDVTGAGVTDEPVTLGKLGQWTKLAHQYIAAAGINLEPSGGGAALVEGTDYEMYLRLGMIRPLTGAAAEADYDLDYTYQTVAGVRVDALQLDQFPVQVYADALDERTGEDILINGKSLYLVPDGEVNWISEEPVTIKLSGPMVTPSGETSPLTFDRITNVT